MPISMPPNGGLDGCPATVCGYVVKPTSESRKETLSPPGPMAAHTYGQLTRNALVSCFSNNVSEPASSLLDSDGPPTPSCTTERMTCAASVPAAESRPSFRFLATAPGLSTICPPAPSTSALIQTV